MPRATFKRSLDRILIVHVCSLWSCPSAYINSTSWALCKSFNFRLCVSLISCSAWPEFISTLNLCRSALAIEGGHQEEGLDRNMAATHSASLCSIVSNWLRVKCEAKGSAEEASRAVSVLQLGAWKYHSQNLILAEQGCWDVSFHLFFLLLFELTHLLIFYSCIQ